MQFLWMILTGLIFSSCGFYMYIYFFSIGYGFSIAACGAVMALLFRSSLTAGTALQCLLLIVYGIRLGGYLLVREMKSAAYRKVLSPEMTRSKKMGMGPKIAIWISCALLYALEVSPIFFRLQNGGGTDPFVIAGVVLMVCGICLEAAADMQKTAAKKKDPRRFVDTGLFRIVRCPNYLGEMIFWTGVLLSGIGAVKGWQWLVCALGYSGIIFVMFSGARRLEVRQNKRYGKDPDYQKFVKTVPILLPFVPLYSVEKYKWLVA